VLHHFTFHFCTPAEKFGCIVTSNRSPLVVIEAEDGIHHDLRLSLHTFHLANQVGFHRLFLRRIWRSRVGQTNEDRGKEQNPVR